MKLCALDTHFLIRLEFGDPLCEDVVDRLHSSGYFCIISETVVDELFEYAVHGSTDELKTLGTNAIQRVRTNFLEPSLNDLKRGLAETFAGRALSLKLIPGGTKNDALIIAETGLHGAALLITDRSPLLRSNFLSLSRALANMEMLPTVYVTPGEFIDADNASREPEPAR